LIVRCGACDIRAQIIREESMRRLVSALLAATAAACGQSGAPIPDAEVMAAVTHKPAAPDERAAIRAVDLAAHIRTLASDEFEGRGPTTPGGAKTRAYIAAEFERIGLQPMGADWFQPVAMVEATLDPAASNLTIDINGEKRALAYKTESVFGTRRVSPTVSFQDSDLVFVGYGVVAPEFGWNDYAGVDVKGKTVVIFVNDPGFATQDATLFSGNAMTYYGRWTYKFEEAARQGAAAALIVHDTKPAAYGWNVVEGSWTGPQLDIARADDGASRALLEGWITNQVARELLKAAGLDFDDMMKRANTRGFSALPMTGLKASATLTQSIRRSEDSNIIGVLKGAEAPDEYVLYMGHWDHLGVNPTTDGTDGVFNGAVDNATGIATILEIAEKFAAGPRPRRSILFTAVTAEESGLLGSAFMAENPPTPLQTIVGGINIDALLPTPPARDMIVVGAGASELEDVLEAVLKERDGYVRPDMEPEKGYFYRSDHVSFAKKGVPMLYADGGFDLFEGGEAAGRPYGEDYTANRYHQPSDEFSEDWPLDGMTRSAEILHEVGARLAASGEWPNWREGNEFRALRDAMMKQ
jgi:Zn-dependent M28 family amino/carboxypeptidase